MRHLKIKICIAIILLSNLIACSNNETYESAVDTTVATSTPNKYFEFFNQQSRLAAGQYTIIAAPKNTGVTDTFVLTITKNDGSTPQTINGQWNNAVGESTTPWTTCIGTVTNACYNLELDYASGVTITLSSSQDSVLYLANQNDSPTLFNKQDAGLAGITETITYSAAQIREVSYAQAYYNAVDSQNKRTTLQDYQALHGFDGTNETHVIFRDTKDLGYGRDMYMRSYHSTDCGGQQVTAFYVRNFKVDVVEGFSYGLVNLEAAINEDLTHHFGTNAIEFSKGFDSLGETCADEAYTRFFTFKSDYSSSQAVHPRLDEVDLDGRGEKAMPQPCISCHGGIARPLDRFNRFVTINANDSSNQIGDTKSRLQAFEVDTFTFSDVANKTQADYEDGLRKLNNAVYCTYAGSKQDLTDGNTDNDVERCADFGGGIAAQYDATNSSVGDHGEWNGIFAREMLLGAYNNKISEIGTKYSAGYVPSGWQPAVGSVPEGADTLFTKVISPNCFVCHGKRGSALGSNRNTNKNGKDIDFSTWAKFISHAEEIQRLVFAEGRMPLGLLNYNNFWDDPEKSALLAAFISPHVTDFSAHVDANNNIIKPGAVVARAGLDRVTKANAAITLNANASLFGDTYTWAVKSSPAGSSFILSSTNSVMVDFEPDTIGTYVLTLTVSNSKTGSTATDEITVLVDNSLAKSPRELTFYDDVRNELVNCANQCHSTSAVATLTPAAAGIPVMWSDDASQPIAIPTSTSDVAALGLYEQFKARVNLSYIEDSLVLKKPSNIHHFGGVTGVNLGFDTTKAIGSVERDGYDLFVNWISEGTVCGGTTSQCPFEE